MKRRHATWPDRARLRPGWFPVAALLVGLTVAVCSAGTRSASAVPSSAAGLQRNHRHAVAFRRAPWQLPDPTGENVVQFCRNSIPAAAAMPPVESFPA